MDDPPARAKLQKALARLTAHRQQLTDQRKALQTHAADMLDHAQHGVAVASKHLETTDNPLVFRYAGTRMREAATLRGIALRAEGQGPDRE